MLVSGNDRKTRNFYERHPVCSPSSTFEVKRERLEQLYVDSREIIYEENETQMLSTINSIQNPNSPTQDKHLKDSLPNLRAMSEVTDLTVSRRRQGMVSEIQTPTTVNSKYPGKRAKPTVKKPQRRLKRDQEFELKKSNN